jgi:hypothetical protein
MLVRRRKRRIEIQQQTVQVDVSPSPPAADSSPQSSATTSANLVAGVLHEPETPAAFPKTPLLSAVSKDLQ